MTPEKLSNQNAWFCSRCKMHKQAVKKFQVFKVPPILIVNLKRFKGMQQKQNTPVYFPLEGFDMSNHVIGGQAGNESMIYDLFGVSNHYGQLQGGHYTAYAKNDGVWYKFNDEAVEEIENTASIVSPAAYNLFFQRRDMDFTNLDYEALRNRISAPNTPSLMSAVKPPTLQYQPSYDHMGSLPLGALLEEKSMLLKSP